MKKKTILTAIGICCVLIIAGIVIIQDKEDVLNLITFSEMKESFATDIGSLKNGAYDNLIATDFEASIEEAESLYHLEILMDTSYKNRTFLENFEIMNQAIDKFFLEDFDKSYIKAEIQMSNDENVYIDYNDVSKLCTDERYNNEYLDYLFGNNTSEGGYMVQTTEALLNTWFSRNAFGGILPSLNECKKAYVYLSGVRQDEETLVHLQDGEITLSSLETMVLDYLNTDKFPLPKSKGITYGIGEARVLDNGEYDGICFKVRRVYKGVPFEYGATSSGDIYIDPLGHDTGEVCYAISTYPDTIVGFKRVNGTIVEKEEITEMISLSSALELLSEKIGENTVYEVRGIELVYRNCEIPEEQKAEIDDILEPKWKIITINQNDDKYTLFYVDVVTGEITERFEYYYD